MRAKKYLFDHLYSQEIVDKNPYHGRGKFCVLFFIIQTKKKRRKTLSEWNLIFSLTFKAEKRIFYPQMKAFAFKYSFKYVLSREFVL